MTPDEHAYLQRAQALLRDAFTPETDRILNAYVGNTAQMTAEGLAWPLEARTDAEAVQMLVGNRTYPDA